MESFSAIILAAGESRRMGTPKPLLEWQGESLITFVVRTLQAGGVGEIKVVVAPGELGGQIAEVVGAMPGVKAVVNPEPGRGMLSSVQAGLRALPEDAGFLVCPCDMPLLKPNSVKTVLNRSMQLHEPITKIVVPTYKGKRGHPTLFSKDYREGILSLDPLQFGLNVVLQQFAGNVLEVETDESVLLDADTPLDWSTLTRRSREEDNVNGTR